MYVPDIKVEISDIDYNINAIAELLYSSFAEKNKSLPFKERVYRAFPELAEKIRDGMDDSEIFDIVKTMMYAEYAENSAAMEERRKELSGKLKGLLSAVILEMLKLFEIEWPDGQADITCYLGLYTVFPRNVISKEYWLHYRTPEEVVIRASIHEINHFILFEKWKSMHGYIKEKEPDHPEVLWFLEEMAIDPTLNIPEIQKLAPYPQKAYKSFYENKIEGIPMEDYITKFFRERRSMADFLDTAYQFILKHHKEIIEKCG